MEEEYSLPPATGRTPSEEDYYQTQQQDDGFENQASGFSVEHLSRALSSMPPASGRFTGSRPGKGRGARRSPTRGPFHITRETTPFAELLAAANAHIPSDLTPGASVDEEFRKKNLLKVINVDFKEVLQASQSLIQTAQSMFEYKGMDIWIILQKYILKASQDPDSQKNLILMVVLLCERGTNFDKYASKMSKEGASMVNILKNRYNLVSKLNKSKANELTLARVGHCFPLLVCSYMEQCLSPTVSDMAMNKWSSGYPKCMKTSAFTALIPRGPIAGFKE